MTYMYDSDSLNLLTQLVTTEKQASHAEAWLLSDFGPISTISRDDLLDMMQATEYLDPELKLVLWNQLLLAILVYEEQQRETLTKIREQLKWQEGKISEYAKLLHSCLELEQSRMAQYLGVYE